MVGCADLVGPVTADAADETHAVRVDGNLTTKMIYRVTRYIAAIDSCAVLRIYS